MKYLKIGELAKQAGIKNSTIRYYERIGVFPKPLLSESGYRQYDETAVKTIKFIVHAKELGFSLKEIIGLLSLRLTANENQRGSKDLCGRVKTMAEIKIADIDKKISSLKSLKEKLIKLKNLCEKKKYDDNCPIIDIMSE